MRLEALRTATLFASLFLLGLAGSIAAAFAVGLSAFVHFIALAYSVDAGQGFLTRLMGRLASPFAASAVMAVSVVAIGHEASRLVGDGTLSLLLIQIGTGALMYVGALLLLDRALLHQLLALARGARGIAT